MPLLSVHYSGNTSIGVCYIHSREHESGTQLFCIALLYTSLALSLIHKTSLLHLLQHTDIFMYYTAHLSSQKWMSSTINIQYHWSAMPNILGWEKNGDSRSGDGRKEIFIVLLSVTEKLFWKWTRGEVENITSKHHTAVMAVVKKESQWEVLKRHIKPIERRQKFKSSVTYKGYLIFH